MNGKRAILCAACCCVSMLFLPGPAAGGPAQGNNGDVIGLLREKARVIYTRYSGVESRREINSTQYDDRDGKPMGSYIVTVNRREYFYKKPEFTVLRYVKDGKETPTKEYRYMVREPVYPPFDGDSDKHYRIALRGTTRVDGVLCHVIDIVPREKTPRHLAGKAYINAETLDLYCLEGTVARYPLGVKSISMRIFFKKVDDAWVMSHGTYTFSVHVPFFYPHRRFVATFRSYEDRLIPSDR